MADTNVMHNAWFWLLLIVAGFVIVALPDNNERLFSISKEHGPSLQDAFGLLLIMVGYIGLLQKVWRRKEKILAYRQTKTFQLCLFILGLGCGLLIASVAGDFRQWWVVGAGVLVVVQAVAFYKALR